MEDHQATQREACVDGLSDCGFLKFFQTSGLKAQNELLQYLIGLWDVGREIFIIGDQELELEVAEIYFIIGLSRRGERVQLFGAYTGGEITNTLIRRHYPVAETTVSGKDKIETIENLPLRMILHTMIYIATDQELHEEKKSQFQYAVDFLAPTIFNWCEGLLVNMKR